MHIELKWHRSVPKFGDALERLETSRQSDLHDIAAESAPVRDHVDVPRANVGGAEVVLRNGRLNSRQLLLKIWVVRARRSNTFDNSQKVTALFLQLFTRSAKFLLDFALFAQALSL